MKSMQIWSGFFLRGAFSRRLALAATLVAAALPVQAGGLVEEAKDAGQAVGTGIREAGTAGKEIGKNIGNTAVEVGKEIGRTAVKVGKTIGEAAKEGGKAVARGVKGEE